MKKILKKTLICVLVLSMVFASTLALVFAKEPSENPYEKYAQGSGYVAFGDSFTRGYGASDHYKDQIYLLDDTSNENSRNVDGAYPYELAKMLGLYTPSSIKDTKSEYWPIAWDAVSLAFVMDLLGIDDGFTDTKYVYGRVLNGRYKTALSLFGDPKSYNKSGYYGKTGSVYSARKLVEDASLISVQLGQADVLLRAYDVYLYGKTFNTASEFIAAVYNFVQASFEALDYFKDEYRVLIENLKTMNPDATIVIIGTMNPVQDAVLWDGSTYAIGGIISPIFDAMNAFYRQCAKDYGCIFVDISNVETPISENTMSVKEIVKDGTKLMGHPNEEGYAQIARLIFQALNEKDLKQYVADTKIRVDLGRFEKIDSVCVDGKTCKDYTFENCYLVVNCDSKCASNLSVYVNVDGDIQIVSYNLSYDEGYIVKKIFSNNHLFGQEIDCFHKIISILDNATDEFYGPSEVANTSKEEIASTECPSKLPVSFDEPFIQEESKEEPKSQDEVFEEPSFKEEVLDEVQEIKEVCKSTILEHVKDAKEEIEKLSVEIEDLSQKTKEIVSGRFTLINKPSH